MVVDGQAVIKDGSLRYTPNIYVWRNDRDSLRVGKFYRVNNDDTFVGFKWERRF